VINRGKTVKITKAKKRALLVLCIVAITIIFSCIIWELFTARYKDIEKVYYSYNSTGSIDYKVYLKPNSMYGEEYLEKDRYYIFKFIDRVDMDFKYNYVANKTANLNVEYNVRAYLQGLHGNENEILWSKEYVLIPDKSFASENSTAEISVSLPVELDYYSRVKEALYMESEVNAPVVLNVVFNIHTTAQTDKGTIEDVISPNLSIPIGSTIIKMEGEPSVTGANRISETVKYRVPVNKGTVLLLAISAIIMIILTVFVGMAKTEAPPDAFEKQITAIFKEYGERLAGMEHTISYHFSDVINVSSIEDMVKIADEIGQPVFYYKVNSNEERKIEFFVFDNNRVYYMVIFGEITRSGEETTVL